MNHARNRTLLRATSLAMLSASVAAPVCAQTYYARSALATKPATGQPTTPPKSADATCTVPVNGKWHAGNPPMIGIKPVGSAEGAMAYCQTVFVGGVVGTCHYWNGNALAFKNSVLKDDASCFTGSVCR